MEGRIRLRALPHPPTGSSGIVNERNRISNGPITNEGREIAAKVASITERSTHGWRAAAATLPQLTPASTASAKATPPKVAETGRASARISLTERFRYLV